MKKLPALLACLCLIPLSGFTNPLPKGFVYLKDIDPSIIQEIRYAGYHNFVGRPITGYDAAECILSRQAAAALAKVQAELMPRSMSLKVYDCYRPQKAVNDFISWSKQSKQQQMKAEFFPNVNKADFFKLGYVAEKSGHSRGSTMDLTIVKLPAAKQPDYKPGQKLVSCIAARARRFKDNSIAMGTGYDCMDKLSHSYNKEINPKAYKNREFLRKQMMKQGFIPYTFEWWHFTLKDEPYPDTYFDFDVK